MSTLTHTAGAPSTTKNTITVSRALKDPTRLAQRIVPETVKFLSDELFRQGTTDSGAVIYNEASVEGQYPSRGDVQQIEPGGVYPMVDIDEGGDKVALSTKHGAGYKVTEEAEKRNQANVVQKGNLKVRNALLRQDAARCLAAFESKVPTINALDPFSVPKAAKATLLRARAQSVNLKLGYNPRTVLINPTTVTDMLLLDEIQNFAPRENTALNPLYNPSISGLWGFNWIENEFVDEDEIILLETKVTGINITENPYRVQVVPVPLEGIKYVIADKWGVPIIDEPGSALVIKGVSA